MLIDSRLIQSRIDEHAMLFARALRMSSPLTAQEHFTVLMELRYLKALADGMSIEAARAFSVRA